MDKITHEMRLQNWTEICRQCQERPQGMSVKQWCKEHGIIDKTTITGNGRLGREYTNRRV